MSRTGNAAARNGVSSAGVTFAAEAESDEIAAQQATLAQPTITPEKAAAFIPFTFEIEGDYPSFANEMQRLIETAYIDFVVSKPPLVLPALSVSSPPSQVARRSSTRRLTGSWGPKTPSLSGRRSLNAHVPEPPGL